jgi:hypothetical protein
MAQRKREDNPYVRLELGLFEGLPQLHKVLVRADEDALGLNVKHRAPGDWLAIARRYGADGGPEVCFGTGYDLCGALLGLESAIAANRWREDTPWDNGR